MATQSAAALRESATAKREQAAALIAKAESLEAQAASTEAIFNIEVGTVLTVTRRDGSEVEGTFQAAKDTDRGILVAVLVGEGFDTETLRLPVSKIKLPEATDAE